MCQRESAGRRWADSMIMSNTCPKWRFSLTSAQVRALSPGVRKTVGSAFPNLIVGHVADAFLRLAGGAADP